MVKIIIDKRECKEIIEEVIIEGMEIELQQLDVADFILQTKNLENKIQTVGVERKTKADLLSSISDKRLLNQMILLKENFDIPLLIIEGCEDLYSMRKFHPNAVRGILATIAVDFQVPIIYTQNKKDTACYLALIARRLEKERKSLNLVPKKKQSTLKEQQVECIASLPGIGPTIAKSILKEFKTIKKITNATEKELQEVEKIGKIKAKEMIKLFEEEFTE